MRWEKMQGGGSGPGKRWGHTCNAVRGGRLLYVFGGYGKDMCQTNQVHVFDTLNGIWNEPLTQGIPPIPRDSHTCTTVGESLFVFGGTDGRNPLNDLHILDTSSNTWYSPTLRGDAPEAREGHSAALVGRRLFIFGGCGKSQSSEIYYHDLHILNTETFVWKRVVPSGTPPSKRDSHTVSSYKNRIIVIGGEDSHDYYLSDVHMLDADTLIWCKLNPAGQPLPPRAGHTTVAFDKNLFVFGGFSDEQSLYDDVYVLNMELGLWTKVTTIGEGPSARFSMAGECLDPQMGGVLVFIGGCNKNLEALDDMYYLHTGLVRGEITRDERRLEKLSLRKQLKMKCLEQNTIIPSYDNDNTLFKVPVSGYAPPGALNVSLNRNETLVGNRAFKAKITHSLPQGGYTIETILDGKPLQGIVFSTNPNVNWKADDNTQTMVQHTNVMQADAIHGSAPPHTTAVSTFETARTMAQNTNVMQVDGVHEEILTGSVPQTAGTVEQDTHVMQAGGVHENVLTGSVPQTARTMEQDTNVMEAGGVHENILTGSVPQTGRTMEQDTNVMQAGGIHENILTGSVPQTPRTMEQNTNVMQADCIHETVLTGSEPDTTAVSTEMKNQALSDVPVTQEIPDASKPPVASDVNEGSSGNSGAPPSVPEAPPSTTLAAAEDSVTPQS